MDLFRRIGIAIVMIVPTFVGGGALWNMFHSWLAVGVWILIMAVVTAGIISGKYLPTWESGYFRFG